MVIDPFDGIALGALDAMFHGLHHIGVELEEKFVQLGQQNIDLWNRRYGNGKLRRWGTATRLQGESRRGIEVLEGARAEGIIASPPYSKSHIGAEDNPYIDVPGGRLGSAKTGHLVSNDNYGTDPAQLGNMPTGEPPSAVISSPPWTDNLSRDGRSAGDLKIVKQLEEKYARCFTERSFPPDDYGKAEGQLGNMPTGEPPQAIVSSPPYATQTVHNRCDIDPDKLTGNPPGPHSQVFTMADYGNSDGQLAAMREGDVDAVIASPPWADVEVCQDKAFWLSDGRKTPPQGQAGYGNSDGQLAEMKEGNPPQAVISSPPFADSQQSTDADFELESTKVNPTPRKLGDRSYFPAEMESEGQLAALPEGKPPIVAKPKLASQENHGIISQKEIISCQAVKTVGSKFQGEADGVNRAAESTSAQLSRDARNLKGLGPKSQQLDLTSQPQNVGVNHIPIGKAEMTVGEDTPGGLSAEQPLTEMDTNVSNVDQQTTSKSITKGIKQKPTEPGTTNSLILKPSVSNVTLPSTVPQNTMQHAPYAEKAISQHPLENAVQMNAERNPKPAPGESITESNLPDTFWEAAKTILLQCHQVLAPGGVAIWVLKAFVRNKKIVDFPSQWESLCNSCGFETMEIIRAWLVEDRGAQFALDGDLVKKKMERKSFFRRLYERKARAARFWLSVLRSEQAAYLWQAHAQLWHEYKTKMGSPKPSNVRPTRARIISAAYSMAYKDAGEPDVETDTQIDYEIVLVTKKV